MREQIENAILNHVLLRIRMTGTPEDQFILVEPHLILHNILLNQLRLFIFIVEHWQEGAYTGWKDISLASVIEIEATEDVFRDRNPKPVDWQLNDQIFPLPND